MDAPFGSWGTQTFIAGLSAGALIAPWVIKGAMDGEAFAAYIEHVLVPELEPGTVIILDNLATHKNALATKALREAGCWFLFLPPYCPDLNPIEMAFSKLKAHLRRIGARTFTDMFHALSEICDLFSPEECWNYFKAAGHVSGQRPGALGSGLRTPDGNRRQFPLSPSLRASARSASSQNPMRIPLASSPPRRAVIRASDMVTRL